MKKAGYYEVIRTLCAIGIALLLGFVVVLFVSNSPVETYRYFLTGPFTSVRRLGAFFEAAIPLTFCGLAVSVVFSAGQFNMGADGQFFIGASAATAAGIFLDLPPVIHAIVALACGIIAGAAAGFIPGFLKSRWGASELVSSLMLNYVFVKLGMYLVTYPLRDPDIGALASRQVLPSSWLTQIIPSTRLHTGLLVLALTVVFCYYFLYRSKWGYETRMLGQNPGFAMYSGMSVAAITLYTQVISGGIAGLAGAVEILGIHRRFLWLASPGYGFDGVIIAILAKNNPLLVPLGAIFLAYVRTGADVMNMYGDVTTEMVSIIQAVIILLVTAEAFLEGYRHKMVVKEAKSRANAA